MRTAKVLTVIFSLFALVASALANETDVLFQVDIEPKTLAVGRKFTVTFVATFAEGTRLYFPETPNTKPFLLVAHESDIPSVAGHGTTEVHRLKLLPVRIGTAVLSPIEVPYITPSGEARVATTPEIRIQVGSNLGDATELNPAPAGEPVPVRVLNTLLIWGLSSAGVAVLAALLGIVVYRRLKAWAEARRPPPPPRPPHEVAYEMLDEIEKMGLIEKGEYKQLALLVSEVLRGFLGGVYGFAGIDMTSYEVLRALEGQDLGHLTIVELEDLLGICDMIKFAKFTPTEEEARGILRRAREVIQKVTRRM